MRQADGPAQPARERILDTAFRLFYAHGPRGVGVDTVIGFSSAEDRAAFAADLNSAVADLVARYHHDDGRPHRLTVSSYPRPTPQHEHAETAHAWAHGEGRRASISVIRSGS